MNFDCTPELSLQLNGSINDDNITWNSCLDGCKHVLPSVQAEFCFFFLILWGTTAAGVTEAPGVSSHQSGRCLRPKAAQFRAVSIPYGRKQIRSDTLPASHFYYMYMQDGPQV